MSCKKAGRAIIAFILVITLIIPTNIYSYGSETGSYEKAKAPSDQTLLSNAVSLNSISSNTVSSNAVSLNFVSSNTASSNSVNDPTENPAIGNESPADKSNNDISGLWENLKQGVQNLLGISNDKESRADEESPMPIDNADDNGSDTTWQEDFEYRLNEKANEIILRKYTGNVMNLKIPEKAVIGGREFQPVFSNEYQGLFDGNDTLTSIDLSNVKINNQIEVFSYHFRNCSRLVELDMSGCDFGNGQIFYCEALFEGCDNLTYIKTPKNVNLRVELPAVFVLRGDYSVEYTMLPFEVSESLTIVREKDHVPVKGLESLEKRDKKETEEHDGKVEIDDGDDTRYIKYKITPENATNKKIRWTSSNEDVVTVDENGRLTGRMPGRAIVTGETEDGGFRIIIIVIVKYVKVKGLELDDSNVTIGLPGHYRLRYRVLPWNATDKNVIWISDDTSVVTVDEEGNVTAVGEGKTKIRVRTVDGDYEKVCTIIVKADYIAVTDVVLTPDSDELGIGEKTYVRYIIYPSDATDKTLKWESSDEKVAKVSKTGEVTAIGEGWVIIIARASNGELYYCEIHVIKKIIYVTGIKVTPSDKTVYVYDHFRISYVIIPSNADDRTVTWVSSDPSIASVDKNGNVIANKPGTVTITVTTNDGNFSAVCIIYVIGYPPEPVTYKLYITDYRKDPYRKDMVRARAENLPDNRYLVIRDSDGYLLRPLIFSDSTLNFYLIVYYYNIRYTDAEGNDKSDYGRCTIRIPIGPGVSLSSGSVRVVGLKDNKLDKSLPYTTGVEDGVPYVTFTTDYFGEFAILYNPNSGGGGGNGNILPDYWNTLNLLNSSLGKTRVLDGIPRTGYGYKIFDILKERHGNR